MKIKKSYLYLLVSFVVLGLVFIVFLITNNNKLPINSNEWQAVFLTNNQVYFGKLSTLNKDNYKLVNVYYLQSDQNISKETSGINLIKLGAEIHGPEDIMYISRDQVMFWENLKTDSRIVKIIDNYK